jgi:ankyrin repeat protein
VDPSLCNTPTPEGITPLMLAAQRKQFKFLLFLLMMGAPPERNPSPAVCKALQRLQLKSGAQEAGSAGSAAGSGGGGLPALAEVVVVDAMSQCSKGRTALHYAAEVDNTHCVVGLLSAHPKPPGRHYKSLSHAENHE